MKDEKGHGSNARSEFLGARNAELKSSGPRPVIAGKPEYGTVSADVPAHQEKVEDIGQESPKSQGLRLFADNNADLHRQSFKPVMDNLAKKADKGVYDPAKATKLWGYHADRAAQAMHKQSGAPGTWHQAFPTSVRREAASNWEKANRK